MLTQLDCANPSTEVGGITCWSGRRVFAAPLFDALRKSAFRVPLRRDLPPRSSRLTAVCNTCAPGTVVIPPTPTPDPFAPTMTEMRHLRNPGSATLLILGWLFLRALIPAGFMLAPVDGRLALVVCDAEMSAGEQHHHHHPGHDHTAHHEGVHSDPTCPYAQSAGAAPADHSTGARGWRGTRPVGAARRRYPDYCNVRTPSPTNVPRPAALRLNPKYRRRV